MKFSVTIPAYKAMFLRECIESILSQTYKDFELIIVNDASPEDLTSIVKSFNDPRIHYYVNEINCGAVNVVDNWNICLAHAQGDYVICMGDDDKLLPNCLEEYNKLIERYPGLGVYHAWTVLIDKNSEVIGMQEPRPEREGIYSMMWGRWYGKRVQYIGDFLFDRKNLVNNGGFYKLPLAWGSDDITSYIAAKDTGIANMQVPGFQYRINAQTISSTGDAEKKLTATNLEKTFYDEFLSRKPIGSTQTEKVFWVKVKEYSELFFIKKCIYTIADDLVNNGIMNVYKYVYKRKKYNLSWAVIAYSIVESIKQKVTGNKHHSIA